MAAWNQDDEGRRAGPGPDPDVLADADEQVRLAGTRQPSRGAPNRAAARSEPAEVTKTYALAEDFFSGVDGAEATPENAVRRLADLAAAGFPVIGLVNLARERIDASADSKDAANDATTADGDVAAPEPTEEDDEYPPLVSALMDAHARAVADSLEFDAPTRLVAVLPLDFPRGEDVDAAALASATAATCGVAALAAGEYAFWRAKPTSRACPATTRRRSRARSRARARRPSRGRTKTRKTWRRPPRRRTRRRPRRLTKKRRRRRRRRFADRRRRRWISSSTARTRKFSRGFRTSV